MKTKINILIVCFGVLPIIASASTVKPILVHDLVGLESLHLRANNAAPTKKYLTTLNEILGQELKYNSYIFIPNTGRSESRYSISMGAGLRVGSILRVPKEHHLYGMSKLRLDDQELFGAAKIKNATEGICGAIAAIHSLVKLGLIKEGDAFAGGTIKKNQIKTAKDFQHNPKGITPEELLKEHEAYGAQPCKMLPGPVKSSDPAAMKKLVTDLKGYMNDPKRTWDCSLFVKAFDSKGQPVLSHVEQVKGVSTKADGSMTIETLNGFDQGNQTTTVPQNPGTNEWTLDPKGPSAKLSGSTDADVKPFVTAGVPVDEANYLCCPKPK